MRYYLTPEPDPDAGVKIADSNGLYQTAQERAKQGEATVSTDEMTGVQALERKRKVRIGRTTHPLYGMVNTYHESILQVVFETE